MSLARIEIEEHRPGFWVAEVEAGYPACRRERVTGGTIVEIVSKVGDAYERMMGRPAVTSQAIDDLAAQAAQQFRAAREIASMVVQPLAAVDHERPALTMRAVSPAAKSGWKVPRAPADLVEQARAIGIPAKGTWTRARVLREVAKVAEGKA